ncbi:MAG: AI-2E family transporter [Pseudomonadota bacterium]
MEKISSSAASRTLVIAAAFIVVVAGMQAAKPLLVPFLLSVFVAVLAAPPLFWLTERGLPKSIAMLLVISSVVIAAIALTALVGATVDDFRRALPEYQSRLQGVATNAIAWLQTRGFDFASAQVLDYFNPGIAMQLVANTLSGFGNALTNSFLILLTVVFILFEASSFPSKLRQISANADATFSRFGQFTDNVKRYIAIKAAASVLTGLLISGLLWLIGVDFPILWGTLAFLLNFVPNIGSIIAAVPAVLLALVQLGGSAALFTTIAFVGVNTLVGNVIEPRFMGRGLGLSTLVVFLSLVFWGWILGPVGMLLSVPLTITIKIAFESHPDTQWLAILLGPEDDHLPDSE